MAEGIRIIPTPETLQQRQLRLEAARRQQLRYEGLVPLYVMWTSDVPDRLANAATQGVFDTVRASGQRREVKVFGSQNFGSGRFSSPDWYLQEAFRNQHLRRDAGFGPQVSTREILKLFYQEPYQQYPHWEVFIVNTDLNSGDANNNFVFGETDVTFPASVQSVKRLTNSGLTPDLENLMTRRLLKHEVGHMFGLPNRDIRTTKLLGKHCTNICSMRQGMSVPEWARLAEQERVNNIIFCNDCTNDLAKLKPRYHPI